MSIFWTAPAALIGLALLALPIAVHLLARQRIRTLPYPSLRFLRQTQLASFRRRSIQDAALLLCRVAIVAAAALALAGPVFQTAARQAAYAERISRAIVVTRYGGIDREIVERAADGAFVSRIITRLTMADAFAEAERWFDQQPPSAREIVIIGALRRGDLNEADISAISRDIGLRFLPSIVETPSTITMPILARRGDALVAIDRQVRADVDATHVSDGPATAISPDLVRVVASPRDTPLAEAAFGAALDAGVPWANFNQRILIAWDGAGTGALPPNTRVIRMEAPARPSAAADAIREVLRAASPPQPREPVLVGADQLAAWTRPPGAPSPQAPIADEGDRRWLWGAALFLLLFEWRMRRSIGAQVEPATEARVA
ncbi:MAG TPA: BatA domain-containing protein [Vicinamibacterales bacterium]